MEEKKCPYGNKHNRLSHSCPFKIDVDNVSEYDESEWCKCCDKCKYECARDI